MSRCVEFLATLFTFAALLVGSASLAATPAETRKSREAQFVDAETGQGIAPFSVRSLRSPDNRGVEVQVLKHGAQRWIGSPGKHVVEVGAHGFQPMVAEMDFDAGDLPLIFRLQPDVVMEELRPDQILLRTRPDATLVQGIVVDDTTGLPLNGVRVRANSPRLEALTDERGFFQLHVPVSPQAGPSTSLRFEKVGFQTEVREHVELWPGGDWTYRVRLPRGGGGEQRIDERLTRRWSRATSGVQPPTKSDVPAATAETVFVPAGTSPSNLTVRVPRTIRVLYTNAVIYETLENYCRHVLPAEWISSWATYTGGSNSLQAGAVALRTYAIGYVNQPMSGTHDICATTACQVYNPTLTTARADLAVAQTTGYVMVNSNLNITRGLTEYSAENNQLGMACGDGFTAPTGGCLADPVCVGEAEFGHGRGMCQWGTAKWATGLKFPGNSFANITQTNGQPRQDWTWIARHYYPNLILAKGSPLEVGDDVRATSATLNVRRCPGDSITNGVNCPAIGSVTSGTTGVITAGPEQVFVDGSGYTWWYVSWNSGISGWVVENYLARVVPAPPAPAQLGAEGLSTTQIGLTWVDTSEVESGFSIEQASAVTGPWTEVTTLPANSVSWIVSNLPAQSTRYFRARAFNLAGYSPYSATVFATTSAGVLALDVIPDEVVDEGETLSFPIGVTGDGITQPLIDFESFENATANGTVLFRAPTFSGSTTSFLETSPNLSGVTGGLPSGSSGTRALKVSWSFTGVSNAWLRLTTAGATTLPNPVIRLDQALRFRMYSSRPLGIAVGIRETVTAAGTPVGSDGGITGPIEWAGVNGQLNGQPQPVRVLPAGIWTPVVFHFASEPITAFAGGNGTLFTASSLAVLEHLALTPSDGPGIYTLFLDQVETVDSSRLTFSLGPAAPEGASVGTSTGQFSWTPAEHQGPSTNLITVQLSDNSVPPRTASQAFSVVVNEVNEPPIIAGVGNAIVHAGMSLTVTNSAADPDLPAQPLVFSLVSPLGTEASVDPQTGILRWLAPESAIGTTNTFVVQVADSGTPMLSTVQAIAVRVLARPVVEARVTGEGVEIRWDSIPGRRYQIQFASSLIATTWEDLGGPITAASQTTVTMDVGDIGARSQRFYRITLLD